MQDVITRLAHGLFQVDRSWTNRSAQDREVAFLFDLETAFEPSFYLIPCVSYNGNGWGSDREPKGLEHEGKPWVFAYNRMGIPAATFSEDACACVGLFVSGHAPESLVSACSLERMPDGRMRHRLYWPERETPLTYWGRDDYAPGFVNRHALAAGVTFGVRFYVYAGPVEAPRTGWTRACDAAWRLFRRTRAPALSPEQTWQLSLRYAREWLLRPGRFGPMFVIGYLPEGPAPQVGAPVKRWVTPPWTDHEIGGSGQNATFANALIQDYLLHGDREGLETGVAVLDAWERHARLDNGLFKVVLWEDPKHQDREIDTCNLGWGALQMMEGCKLAQKAGIERPRWLDMGLRLCDFFCHHCEPPHYFGKSWTQNGEMLAAEGSTGCFLIMPMLEAFRLTGKAAYRECAEKAFRGYVARDLDAMQCTAGALDTYCIDKESCWPLLRTGIELFELTGDRYYLDKATLAGYYLASWLFFYDTLYPADSDFARYGYSTSGGTSVSVVHPVLDPWGALISVDWLRLARATGNEQWREMALATWRNGLLGVSDGSLVVHGMVRPAGSQGEGFQNCNWKTGQCERTVGMMNDWLVAWPTAFRLISLMREPNWQVFEQW